MNVKFRDKIRAALWHFLITAVVGSLIATLVFLVWFPPPFATMMDGIKLFAIVLGCDLILGPLMSLVIFDRGKSRRSLIIDYAVVGVLQLAALLYGVTVVAQYRPVYIAFTVDRFDVVSAGNIEKEDLIEATDPQYKRLPLLGPKLVVAVKPDNSEERTQSIFLALAGKDISARPKFYRPYESKHAEIVNTIHPLKELFERNSDREKLVMTAVQSHHLSPDNVGWLSVKHPRGFWIALMDRQTAMPIDYLPIEPY